jgi:hypothetical protein
MMQVWVMSKSYVAPGGETLPVAWSYGYNHSAMGYQANGWGLVWLSLDTHQLEFIRAGIDPNVQFVGIAGREMSPPTQLLLDTYADKLAGAGPWYFRVCADLALAGNVAALKSLAFSKPLRVICTIRQSRATRDAEARCMSQIKDARRKGRRTNNGGK